MDDDNKRRLDEWASAPWKDLVAQIYGDRISKTATRELVLQAILDARVADANRATAEATRSLVKESASIARWTKCLAMATFALAVATAALAIAAYLQL